LALNTGLWLCAMSSWNYVRAVSSPHAKSHYWWKKFRPVFSGRLNSTAACGSKFMKHELAMNTTFTNTRLIASRVMGFCMRGDNTQKIISGCMAQDSNNNNWATTKMTLRCALNMGVLKTFESPKYDLGYFWAFVLIDLVNVPIKFEVRSFTRYWDNRGYFNKLGSPWICIAHPPFGIFS